MDFASSPAEHALGVHPKPLELSLAVSGASVCGTLNVPPGARAAVALFTPRGTSRFEATSRFFGQVLEQAGIATLVLDPLPASALFADQAREIVRWLEQEPFTTGLPIGLLVLGQGPETNAADGLAMVAHVKGCFWCDEPSPRQAELASEFFVKRLLEASWQSG